LRFRGDLWDRSPAFGLNPRNAPKFANVVRCQDVTTRRGKPCNENIVGAYPFTRVFRVRPDGAGSFTRVLVQLHQLKSGAELPAYDNALLLLEIDCPAGVDYRLLIQSATFFP